MRQPVNPSLPDLRASPANTYVLNAIAGRIKEPYARLVLFLAATGLRIGEALAIKRTDFKDNVLHVTRRIYDGDVDAVKSKRSERKLPIDPILVERMEKFGKGQWVFRSRKGHTAESGQRSKAPHQTGCKGTRHLAWRLARFSAYALNQAASVGSTSESCVRYFERRVRKGG